MTIAQENVEELTRKVSIAETQILRASQKSKEVGVYNSEGPIWNRQAEKYRNDLVEAELTLEKEVAESKKSNAEKLQEINDNYVVENNGLGIAMTKGENEYETEAINEDVQRHIPKELKNLKN